MNNKKPLLFLTELLEPSLFSAFETHVIEELCEPGFFRTNEKGQREDFYGVVVTVHDSTTGAVNEVLLSSTDIMMNEIFKAKYLLLSDIDNEIIATGDLKHRDIIVATYQTAISFIINKLETATHLHQYSIIAETIKSVQADILEKYPPLTGQSTPKIQWLGKLNQLTTLIYELWNGQDKGKNAPSTRPLLKAQKKDLEELLINNFLDINGKSLSRETISDYLNTSKPEKRAKQGNRIELNYK